MTGQDRRHQDRVRTLRLRWASRLLLLYPSAWRRRYLDEVAALLAQHPIGARTALSLLAGAMDAHLNPRLLVRSPAGAARRAQSANMAAVYAAVIFILAQMVLEHSRGEARAQWRIAAERHPQVHALVGIYQIAASVVVVTAATTFLLTVGAVGWTGMRQRQHQVLRPLGAAAMVALAWTGLTAAAAMVAASRPGTGIRPLQPIGVALELLWLGATPVLGVLGAAALRRALARGALGRRALRAASITLGLTVSAMAVCLLASLMLMADLWRAHAAFMSPWWSVVILSAMGGAAAIAAFCLRPGLSAWELGRPEDLA